MALWGNSDAVSTLGTANLRVVNDEIQLVGSATSFGNPGFAKTGDIIELGFPKNSLGVGTYFGSAVIVGIASTTTLTIGSTIGLTDYVFNASTGVSGINTQFQVREAPISSYQIPRYSEQANHISQEVPSQKTIFVGTAATGVGIGTSAVFISNLTRKTAQGFLEENTDSIVNNGNNITITSLGSCIVAAGSSSAVGLATIFIDTSQVPHIDPDHLEVRAADPSKDRTFANVTGFGATSISIGSTFAYEILKGEAIELKQEAHLIGGNDKNDGFLLGLNSGVTAAISSGDEFNIQRLHGGFDTYVYSVDADLVGLNTNSAGVSGIDTGAFRTAAGWVGVTTYLDNQGNLRVKKEVLCAMSGITTGNYPVYDGSDWLNTQAGS